VTDDVWKSNNGAHRLVNFNAHFIIPECDEYVVCNLRHYVIPVITYVICGRSPQKPMIVKMQAKSIHFKSYISKPLLFILRLFNISKQLITVHIFHSTYTQEF